MSDQTARMSADSLGHFMLREIVQQFIQLPGFSNLTQAQQQVHLDRLEKVVRMLIAEALGIIFSAEYPAVAATLGRISIGKGIAGAFEVDRTAESRHELMDRAGQKVVIVMADPDRYYKRMADVKAQTDQGDLFHDPSQPLGHMGVEEPPAPKPDEPAPDAGGESGVDDAMPEALPDHPMDMVTPAQVCEMLGKYGVGVSIEVAEQWPPDQLEQAAVWALAASNDQIASPALPEFLYQYAANLDPKFGISPMAAIREALAPPTEFEPVAIPDAAIDAEIAAGLKLRGISVKARTVRNWSQSQRVAAVSWLQRKATMEQRPEFIPAPTPPTDEAPNA